MHYPTSAKYALRAYLICSERIFGRSGVMLVRGRLWQKRGIACHRASVAGGVYCMSRETFRRGVSQCMCALHKANVSAAG